MHSEDKKYREFSRYAATDKKMFRSPADSVLFRALTALCALAALAAAALAVYLFGFGGTLRLGKTELSARQVRAFFSGGTAPEAESEAL